MNNEVKVGEMVMMEAKVGIGRDHDLLPRAFHKHESKEKKCLISH